MSQVHNDQYIILQKIGEGGMGTVYLAEDTLLERKVAIKSLNKPNAPSAESLDSRFQQEALALARLNHPNITHLYSFVPRQDTYWMVMEYVEGKTLEDWLRLKKTLSPQLACSIICQMLDGLEHAHRKGIIHRDLKPANVMISVEGEVKIMDFGIARIRNSQRLTQHGKSVGTLEYMAPEQIQGKEGDELTDVYATGNILYEMLSGQPPFVGDTDYHLMKAKLEERVPLNSSLLTKASPALQQVIFKALERNPSKRYTSVKAFKDALIKSCSFPLLNDNALVEALASDEEENFVTASGKNLPPALKKLKTLVPVAANFNLSFKHINAQQAGRYVKEWSTDKSTKLLIAVVVVCALLLIWNYFRGHDEVPAPLGNNKQKDVVPQEQHKPDVVAAYQPIIEQQLSEPPVTQRVPVPAEGGGSDGKEKSKPKPKAGKDSKPPAQSGTNTPEPVEEQVVEAPVEKHEPKGPISVPAGKRITVVLAENLTSEEKSRDGETVRLYSDEEVSVNGSIIIKKGATVTGKIVDVVPSTGRRRALIGFVIHSIQARDGSSIRVRSERFRQKAQNDNEPAMYKAGSLFTIELGKGLVN